MRLADFILRDMESILVEWEAFAATLFCGQHDPTGLARRRETHSGGCGNRFVSPPDKASSGRQIPRAPKPMEAPETAAQTHAWSAGAKRPRHQLAGRRVPRCKAASPGNVVAQERHFSERSAEFAATSRFFPVGLQAECRSDPDGDEIRDWFGPKLTPSTAQGAREKS